MGVQEYNYSLIHNAEIIYIDSSSLMDSAFVSLLSNLKDIIRTENKKIIVTDVNYSELIGHTRKNDEAKKQAAERALSLLKDFSDLFTIEENIIEKPFADPKLISRINLDRLFHRVLFIANDRPLTADIFRLNEQQSCKGKSVWVCFIHASGWLQKCECVNRKASPKKDSVIQIMHSSRDGGDHSSAQAKEVSQSKTIDNNKRIKMGGATIAGIGIGIALAELGRKYGPKLVQTVKGLIKKS